METIKIVTLNLAPRKFYRFRSAFHYQALAIKGFIEWNQPDVILAQGLEDWMLQPLDFITKDYTFYGRSNNGKHNQSDYRNCVMFLKSKFSFLKGSTISLDTSKKNASCMTCVHLELNRTHQSILFCSTQFKNARHIERCGKNALEIIQEFPSLTPIVIGGDFSVYKQMNDDLLNIKYKTLPQEPISFFKELVHSTSSQYRPKDCLYVSREITLKEMKPITSMYMGSFPSHSTPMMAVISIPLKEM